MQYDEMPMRAYEIGFTDNGRHPELDNKLPFRQVYQGRSASEAVRDAEIDQLDNPCYPEINNADSAEAAWNEHWDRTVCKPRLIVSSVRDLGIIANQEALSCPDIA